MEFNNNCNFIYLLLETSSRKGITRPTECTGAKEIKLVTNVDASLLGGLKVQIGSNVIDLSLKGQLRELATKLDTSLF